MNTRNIFGALTVVAVTGMVTFLFMDIWTPSKVISEELQNSAILCFWIAMVALIVTTVCVISDKEKKK